MVQRPARHFSGDNLAVVLVQGSPARLVAQLKKCCHSGRSPDYHNWARINKIQANDLIHLVLLCLLRTTQVLRIGQKQKRLHIHCENFEKREASFEKLNIELPSLEETQKLNSLNKK